MALSYADAMNALHAMFPSWDAMALADLLEANDGHFESTVDMVLAMDPPAAATSTASAQSQSPPPAPSSSSASSRMSPRRKARVTLPPDFLVLPDDVGRPYHVLSEQEQRDAALAEMLQNEIFRQELFANEEFAEHFRGSRMGGSGSSFRDRPSATARGSVDKSAAEIASETFSAMSVKFASMSEAMKKKASEMYMRFQTRADAPSQKDPYSHRPLMADDSSDEEDVDGHRAVRNRHKDTRPTPFTHTNGPVRRASAYANKKDE